MEVHAPLAVLQDPDGGDVGVAAHGFAAAGYRLGRVIDDGGDDRAEEGDVRVENFDRGQGALGVELPGEGCNLRAGLDFLLDVQEVWHELPGEGGAIPCDVGGPEVRFGGEDVGRFGLGLT